jgi:hypothetical protein
MYSTFPKSEALDNTARQNGHGSLKNVKECQPLLKRNKKATRHNNDNNTRHWELLLPIHLLSSDIFA